MQGRGEGEGREKGEREEGKWQEGEVVQRWGAWDQSYAAPFVDHSASLRLDEALGVGPAVGGTAPSSLQAVAQTVAAARRSLQGRGTR